jgi:hypothetical protein
MFRLEQERFQKDWVGGEREEEGEDSGRKRTGRRAGRKWEEVICEGTESRHRW